MEKRWGVQNWCEGVCAKGKVEEEGVDNYVLRIKLANFYLTFVGLFVIRRRRRKRQRTTIPGWDEMEPANFARHMIPKEYKKKRSSSSSVSPYNPPTFFTSLPYTCRAIPKLILGGWKWIWGVLQVESLTQSFIRVRILTNWAWHVAVEFNRCYVYLHKTGRQSAMQWSGCWMVLVEGVEFNANYELHY